MKNVNDKGKVTVTISEILPMTIKMCPWQFINGEQEAAESAPDNMLGFLRNFYNQTEALSFFT